MGFDKRRRRGLEPAGPVPSSTEQTTAIAAAVTAGVEPKADKSATINAQTGDTYAAALTDIGKLVTLAHASACEVTIPAQATVTWPAGAELEFAGIGAGAYTFVGGGAAVINKITGKDAEIAGQWGRVKLKRLASNSWLLTGDLADAA